MGRGRPGKKWDWKAEAGRLWPMLVALAAQRRTITYGELAKPMGMLQRVLKLPLDLIGRHVRDAGLPPLSILVVQKRSGRPGDGIVGTRAQDFEGDLMRVYEHRWDDVRNPFA